MSEKKVDTLRIRQVNRREIFDLIKHTPYVTRADIARRLDLSFPTVTSIIGELETAGLIRKEKSRVNTGGRSSMAYVCEPNAGAAVGIQLSAREMKGLLLNLEGRVIGNVLTEPAEFEISEAYRRTLGGLYRRLLAENGIDETAVIGVGITVPQLTDADGSRITANVSKGLTDVRKEELAAQIPVQSRLFHDLTAVGYDRRIRTSANVFYLSVDSTIGGAILIRDDVYVGDGSKAGEIGHVRLEKNGRRCYCGNRGCMDAYCNTLLLQDFAGGSLEDFFDGLRQGKEGYAAFWESYVEDLAEAVYTIRMLFDCRILIGGKLGRYAPFYLDAIREIIDRKNLFTTDRARDFIFADENGENAAAIGAAMYFIERRIDELSAARA